MNFFESGLFHMRIDLSGGDTGMAQHRLHRPQIRPVIQEMGGKRMTQHMGGNRLGDSGSDRAPLENLPKTLPGHGPSQPGQQQRLGRSRPDKGRTDDK